MGWITTDTGVVLATRTALEQFLGKLGHLPLDIASIDLVGFTEHKHVEASIQEDSEEEPLNLEGMLDGPSLK